MASCSPSQGFGSVGETQRVTGSGLAQFSQPRQNAITSQVHDRMRVILDKADYELWLDPGFTDVAALAHMMKPYDASNMRSYAVSSRINQVSNDDPTCALPTEIVEAQDRLF